MTVLDDTGASIDTYAETRQKIATAVLGVRADMLVDNEDAVIGKLVSIMADKANAANEGIQYSVASRDPDAAPLKELKKLVKLNGLTANEGYYSTVSVTVTANAAGTKILAGDKIADPNSPAILWSIDSQVILAPYASSNVSVTCDVPGAIPALPGTLTLIKTPRGGWASVTNPLAASVGDSPETAPALRQRRERRARSYGKTTFWGVWSALEDIDDVTEVFGKRNLTLVSDAYGIPGRSMRFYVRGGSDATIAEVLFKLADINLDGTTTAQYTHRGHAYDMKFSRPTDTPIAVEVFLTPISTTSPADFPATGEPDVKTAVFNFSAANQKMGIDAIPQAFAAAANVVAGYYVDHVEIDGVEAVVTADLGESLIVASEDDVTVTVI